MKLFWPVDPDFARANFKDQLLAEKIIQDAQRKASVAKIVVGSLLTIMSIAVGYAINRQNIARDFKEQAYNTIRRADSLRNEAKRQMLQAESSRQRADEAHKFIQQQLEDCRRKNSKK